MKFASVCFYSNDIPKVVDFYTNILRLKINYRCGDQFVSFDYENNVTLSVKKAVEAREIPGAQTFFVDPGDIKADYERFKDAGVEFYKELTEESWGTYFSILDPDKNKTEFIKRKIKEG